MTRTPDLGGTGPLSQGVQARWKALRTPHINGMEARKKRPRGFKKEARGVQVSPLNPLSVAPCAGLLLELRGLGHDGVVRREGDAVRGQVPDGGRDGGDGVAVLLEVLPVVVHSAARTDARRLSGAAKVKFTGLTQNLQVDPAV